MSLLRAAKRAYERGGTAELVKAGRRRLAKAIYPGPLPKPAPKPKPVVVAPPPPAPKPEPVKHMAGTVTYADALAWFAPRRPTYVRLAKAVQPYVDVDGLILDVGANIGYFTKILGETLGFNGTVHLFEPIPNLAQLCRQTVAELPFNTVVHEFGLSDADEAIDIFVAANGNLGWNTLIGAKTQKEMTALQIQVRTFDAAGITDTPSFVKIDVEGAEYKVLRGMLASIEQWSPRPAILCEVGWGTGHPAWDEELAVFAELDKLGYRVVDLDGKPIELANVSRTTDVIFLPAHIEVPVPDEQEAAVPAAAPAGDAGPELPG